MAKKKNNKKPLHCRLLPEQNHLYLQKRHPQFDICRQLLPLLHVK